MLRELATDSDIVRLWICASFCVIAVLSACTWFMAIARCWWLKFCRCSGRSRKITASGGIETGKGHK